jgi:hypothetical protein
VLRTKHQVIALLQEIHETEDRIAEICFLRDRAAVVIQLSSLGLDIIEASLSDPGQIILQGNIEPKRVGFMIGCEKRILELKGEFRIHLINIRSIEIANFD